MKKKYFTSYLFILPIYILFAVFVVYPVIYNFIISFYNWNGISSEKIFCGLENFKTILVDKTTWICFKNFLIVAVSTTTIQAALGLLFASFFIRKIKFSGTYRILFYIPVVATSTIIGNIFSRIFETNRGYLNTFLRFLHLGSLCRPWLASPKWALVSVIFVNIWQWTGYSMLMYYSNMLNIPQELYEAATIDGAGSIKQFTKITFPLLRGTHFTLFILGFIGALKFFDLPYVLTGGGPAHATETFSTYIYIKSFDVFKQGQASAIAVIVILIALIITAIQLKLYYRNDKDKELAG